jgi:Rho GTPase-activating protein 1
MKIRDEYNYIFSIADESREDFSDLAELGVVDVVGDDKGGRKIIVVSACKLPANKNFDNQRFLR